MKKKYEKPSFEVIEIELEKCIAIANSDIAVNQGQSSHQNVNGQALDDSNFGGVVDINPDASARTKSRW